MPQTAGRRIVFWFHSRDLHFVLGPAKDGKPVRFEVTLDGQAPGENCGSDSSPDGTGTALLRSSFLDPGIHALDFTFG